MPVAPPLPRFQVESTESGVRITIPSQKNWLIIIFLSIWLAGWSVGGLMAIGTLVIGVVATVWGTTTGDLQPSAGLFGVSGFMLIWLAGWAIGEFMVLYTILWRTVGKEVIDVGTSEIIIANKIFSFSRPKEYSSQYIKDLRVSQPSNSMWSPWSRMNTFWGKGEGVIAFDYGAKTFRFGSGLDDAEAKMILAEIAQHYPQYLSRNS
jgi:hypothetical protein